jgi:pyruvate dehydrogenase E2 component (dihydrolipoamide acetyltransferase)
VVPILTPIAFLDEQNEEALPGGPANNDPAQPFDVFHSQPASQPHAALRATPRARALARKEGLDVSAITGSGPREMVTAADIRKLIQSQAAFKATPVAKRVAQDLGIDLTQVSGSGPHGKIMRGDVERAAPLARPALSPDLAALSGLRSIIANRLSASWLERPQVTLTTEADATFLVALRKQMQEEWRVKISYNAILMKLVAKALAEHPAINARLTHNGIQQLDEINIGLAVDTPRGLLVPVIRAAAVKSVVAIHDEFTSLA